MKIRIILITSAAVSLLMLGCNSVPVGYEKPSDPTQIKPLDFSASKRPVNINRGQLSAKDAVAYSNWAWTNGGSRADYQLAARTLAASLEARDYLDQEEQLRLAVMTLQNGLLAGDREVLQTGIRHWEQAYASLGRISYAGEVESYLVACRIAGSEPLKGLSYRANVTITQTLK